MAGARHRWLVGCLLGADWLWIDGHELGPFDQIGSPRFLAEDRIGVAVRTGAAVDWLEVRAPVEARHSLAGAAR